MKPLQELDHYEVLEVGRDATPEEIERAYRLARDAFAEGSLATYSLLDEGEAAALRERIEAAYRVLADPVARQAYDASLDSCEPTPPEAPLAFEPAPEHEAASLGTLAELGEMEAEEEGAPWDGARLRRARLLRGIEIEQIAQVTKISPSYLRFLEEERFASLPPAAVYVRGFVHAYARCLGLDGSQVAASYLERYRAAMDRPRRAKLRERR